MRIPIAVAVFAGVALLALPAGAAPPPKQQIAQLKRQVAALKTKVTQLKQQKADADAFAGRMWRFQRTLGRRLAAVDPCGVTRPNASQPPGDTFGAEFHGNGQLWVGVPYANVVVNEPSADGTVSMKYGWWRGVSGTLSITGRRLDGTAPPLSATVPDGYGDTGFQSSGISFPTEGCWEVTGRAGGTTLTFVTLVLAS